LDINSGQWVCLINSSSVYGMLGVAAATNFPGGRTGGVTWVDASNNLWLFGGNGASSFATPDSLNDLWTYSSSTHMWTWVLRPAINEAEHPEVFG